MLMFPLVLMIVAAVGILINGICAWLFASGRNHDLNIRGAVMHMAADALVSVGVVVAVSIWHGRSLTLRPSNNNYRILHSMCWLAPYRASSSIRSG